MTSSQSTVCPGDRVVHDGVTHSIHLWKGEKQRAESETSDRGACPFGPALPDGVREILELVEHRLEAEADEPRGDPQKRDEEICVVVSHNQVMRDLREEWSIAEESSR